jgi:hypothetical protein
MSRYRRRILRRKLARRMRSARVTIALVAGAAVLIAVVVTLLVVSGSDTEDSGRYAGLSDQRLPVRLTASNDRRRLALDVSWVAHCGRMQSAVPVKVHRTVRRAVVRLAPDGGFSWRDAAVQSESGYLKDRQRLELRGRRAADGTITGTWRAERRLYLARSKRTLGRCSTGDVAFRAQLDGSVRLPPPRTDAAGNRVFALPGAPELVAAGAGGVWTLTAAPQRGGRSYRRTLGRLDLETGAVMSRTLQASGQPVVAVPFAAGEGAGWVAMPGGLDVAGAPKRAYATLARLDARTHAVMARPDPRLTGVLRDMSVGAGAVWLLVQSDAHRHDVLKADPRDGSIQRKIALPAGTRIRVSRKCFGFENAQIAAGTADAVWITSAAGGRCSPQELRGTDFRNFPIRTRRLHRIAPRSGRVTRTIALEHSYERLAASRSALWGTTCAGRFFVPQCSPTERPALHRIGTRDGRPASVTRLPAGRVTGLAATDDAAWISHIGRSARGGTLLRVDRATGRVSTVLRFEGAPSPVSIGEGGVWVIDTFARRLFRVPTDPPPEDGPAAGA